MKKKYLMIITIVIFLLIFIGLIIFTPNNENIFFDESFVIRNFSKSIVSSGEQVEVTLFINVGKGDTYYVLEEYIPLGWTIVDGGMGETSDLNRLAWFSFSFDSLDNSNIVYTLKAPSKTGKYDFNGTYGFEGMGASATTTLGETTITVA